MATWKNQQNDAADAHDDRERPVRPLVAEDDRGQLLRQPVDHHQGRVQQREDAERHQPQEVQAAGSLLPAEETAVPGKTGQEGGRHRHTRGDLERREHEEQQEVDELLGRLVGLPGDGLGQAEVQVGAHRPDAVGDDVPGRRHQVAPVAGGEDQRQVDDAGEGPERRSEEVPVAAQPEVLAAGECHDR
jgi:hypothetical protein